jgi:DNA-binding transcriptional ArsR family regulator
MAGGEPRWDSDDSRIRTLDLMKTQTRRRILSLLLVQESQGSGGLYLRELARAIGTSAATASYHLEKLEEFGLVRGVSTGYRKYFLITNLGKRALAEKDAQGISFSASIERRKVYSKDRDEVVLENESARVVVVPNLGSRVVELRSFAVYDFLHRLYPRKGEVPEYEQYGGLEHTLNPFPGIGYLSEFEYRIGSSELHTFSDLELPDGLVRYRKSYALDRSMPLLRITHSFQNLSDRDLKFSWSSHPEISIGGNPAGNQIIVPEKRVRILGFTGNRTKIYVHPTEPWCAATDPATGMILGELFPKGTVSRVGIWQDTTYYTLELIVDQIGLPPDGETEFSTWIAFTRGSEETVRGLCTVLSLWEERA